MPLFIKVLFASLFLFSCGEATDEAKTRAKIFLNGTIYTGDDANPVVEAVVVEGNRIVFVGAEQEALKTAPDGAVVDLGGAYMYPGFTDAHTHLRAVGNREQTLNLEGTSSLAELVEKIKTRIESASPGEVITGRGWIETHWPEGRFPTAADLDAISPANPVILIRADGHAAVVNTSMMNAAGLTATTEVPFGGDVVLDEAGNPNGILIDAAMSLVAEIAFSDPSQQEIINMYQVGGAVYNAYGWTGVHSMSVPLADVQLIEGLARDGHLTLRVYNSLNGGNPEVLGFFSNRIQTPQNGLITTRAIKLYIDGSLGSRGAILLEPYSDDETTGLQQMKKELVMPILIEALKAGIQINTHAIGDGGNRLLLDWYEEAFAAVPADQRAIAEPRWRDEHAQILNLADIPRFAELGVIPSMQPSHAIGDLHFAPERLGLERLSGAYAWRLLIDAGAIIAGGTDAPVERGDPRVEFYAAVARKDLSGFSGQGWHPELAVSREEALKMFTIWPAYAAFMEDDLGTIEAGKLADFTVFSGDIMTIPEAEILEVEVVMTVVDGKIIYRRD
ncbi:MAG: amidohydrolase [Proteobacteria bacterium]|nr:amidohydrolase [Pseudomonadota bacterium]MCH8321721.1 amidohydrolase [Pseudomonadota bacterium]